jgi:hypothetical protein
MAKIFLDGEFPEVSTNAELKSLISNYPQIDPIYLEVSTYKFVNPIKEQIEEMWVQYEPYSDPDFSRIIRIKGEFLPRCWEMYVACSLLEQGLCLERKNTDEGPDITLLKDGTRIHIECRSMKRGDNLPPITEGIFDLPLDQMILRFSNAMDDKMIAYEKYLKLGLIKENEQYIVAVSYGEVGQYPDGTPPVAIRHLYGVGDHTISFPIDGGETTFGNRTQGPISKKSGKLVHSGFFATERAKGISGVIYSPNHIYNHPTRWGADFVFVPNFNANNPHIPDFLQRGAEWKPEDDHFILMRKTFKFNKHGVEENDY